MAKRATKSVTIKINKNGTMTLRSTGGVDLRKIVPSLFEQPAQKSDTPSRTPKAEDDR